MNFFWKFLADKLTPYFEPTIQGVMYRATDAQLATDTLAEHLGLVITIDGDTATVRPLN